MTIQLDWMFPSIRQELSIIRDAPATHVSQERNEGGRVPDEGSGPQDQSLLVGGDKIRIFGQDAHVAFDFDDLNVGPAAVQAVAREGDEALAPPFMRAPGELAVDAPWDSRSGDNGACKARHH